MTRYTKLQDFPAAVSVWAGRPLAAFPPAHAPTGYIAGADGENRILADLFARLCAADPSRRMVLLLSAIDAYSNTLDRAIEAFGGKADVSMPFSREDRELAVRSRPYRVMIQVMRGWNSELHEAAMSEIGVGFIDQVARTRASA